MHKGLIAATMIVAGGLVMAKEFRLPGPAWAQDHPTAITRGEHKVHGKERQFLHIRHPATWQFEYAEQSNEAGGSTLHFKDSVSGAEHTVEIGGQDLGKSAVLIDGEPAEEQE